MNKSDQTFRTNFLSSDELRQIGFGEIGEDVLIASTCTIVGTERIFIGKNVRIDPYTIIIVASNAKLTLGRNIHLGGMCHIAAACDVTLEDFAGLSQGVKLYSATDDYSGETLTNPTIPARFKSVHKAPITIGKHAIVGSGSVVLPGANLAEGTSVGALSLVTKPTLPWGIYAGAPARRLRDRSKNLLRLEQEYLHAH